MYAYVTICDPDYHLIFRNLIFLACTALHQFLPLKGSHPHEYNSYPF